MTEYNFNIHFFKISEHFSGQRIDNFLKIYLKAVPKSMIYRIIRTGKVRVNKKKVNFYYKLKIGDLLRIPSVQKIQVRQISACSMENIVLLKKSVIYEDNHLLILNKPSSIAVHDGSGVKFNIIDGLRNMLNSKIQFLELVHRLDRDTSGILLLAKNRTALISLQEQWRLQMIQKKYTALVCGSWNTHVTSVSVPILQKKKNHQTIDVHISFENIKNKKNAKTCFQIQEVFVNLATLLIVQPITGRTHQIRIHTQYAKHPIIGDRIYGNEEINVLFKKIGFSRLFLHASSLRFIHPNTKKDVYMHTPLDQSFRNCLIILRRFKHGQLLQ